MIRIVNIRATAEQLRCIPERVLPIVQETASVDSTHYKSLPKFFIGPEQWPKTSNLHCWECGQTPNGYPRFSVTQRMRTDTGTVLYCVRGVFHDWCCAAKYIKTYHQKDEAELLSYLCEVEAKFSGRKRLNIVESSSKFQMKQFAGEDGITIEQWNRINDRRTAEGTMYADQHG